MTPELLATMDAIKILTDARRELLNGPDLPYSIVLRACSRLETEARVWLTGKA